MEIVIENVKHGLMISVFVFVMMLLIDYLSVMTGGRMHSLIGKGSLRQYVVSSGLGAVPGCLGAFMNVSFYVRGLLSFGAIVGGMLATSGDAGFVMLAMFPKTALFLFCILFSLGVVWAFIIDKMVPVLKIEPCEQCQSVEVHSPDVCRFLHFKEVTDQLKQLSLNRFLLLVLLLGAVYGAFAGLVGPESWNWERVTFVSLLGLASFIIVSVPEHYLEEHIWNHIAKKHLWKIFLWSFGVLLIVDIGSHLWDLEAFVRSNMLWVLVISGLVSLIPEFGPQLVFVMMFAEGIVPFSVLLTSAIVQDGHGILPLLSHTVKDSLLVKLFNLAIGLILGLTLFSLGY
ncbi:MAG: putative manganese transporter [Candidatus Glassbacteria bacterium]